MMITRFRRIALLIVAALELALLVVAPASSVASTDPGVAFYQVMHERGATMPPSWAQIVDADRGPICRAYSTGYYDRLPVGEVDEFGVTPALAKSTINESGFCGGTK